MRRFSILACILCLLAILPACRKHAPPPEEYAVIPVTTPTVYRYGPCAGELDYSQEVTIGNTTVRKRFTMRHSVIEADARLIWHIMLVSWVRNGKWYTPPLPLLEITQDTDRRGVPGDQHISTHLNRTDSANKDFFEKLDKKNSGPANLPPPLQETAIVTGQPLFTKQSTPFQGPFTDLADIVPLLDGEFVRDGVTYVVTSLEQTAEMKDEKSGAPMKVNIQGTFVYRKDNMEPMEIELTVILLDMEGETGATCDMRVVSSNWQPASLIRPSSSPRR